MLVGIYWVVPESVRWLTGAGRLDEAEKIIENASKANGIENPLHGHKFMIRALGNSESNNHKTAEAKATILDLFRPPKMALRALNMCFQVPQ